MGDASVDDVLRAFRVFDTKNTGTVTVDTLTFVLSKLGNPMQPEDVKEILLEADMYGSGEVDYAAFTTEVLFRS
ncbi:putative calmodulin-like protein 2 [Diplonema papillatum]|nr:putative calmodulin-like protein 2 [Diplonema papillatum]